MNARPAMQRLATGSAAAAAFGSGLVAQAREKLALAERRKIIRSSPFFDAGWYLSEHDDVRAAGADPLEHYLHSGEAEGRNPGPDFDAADYVWLNPVASGQALTHYHRSLAAVGLTPPELMPLEVVDMTTRAISDGWIDPDWSPTSPGIRVHPWLAYRRSGGNPSPLFDEADYRARMPSTERRTAVEHWLSEQQLSDTDEPRMQPLVVSTPDHLGRPLVAHRVRHRTDLANVPVVVMIHAFYPELLGELLDRVRLLPGSPHVLISVTDQRSALIAHAAVDAALGSDHHRLIKVVPNRGRNFAPLLVSFAEELPAYEVVLHLHTKRSLYTGSDRNEWRDHLLRGLLRSAAAVDATISLLAPASNTDSNHDGDSGLRSDAGPVGLVHPPIWPGMPHWAHHWLANSAHGQRLYDQLGVTDRVAAGHVVYPVGGMFWARVDALQPLLDLQLTVADFERESGQTDRTLAHALERTVPAAARVAGFSTVEVDLDAAQWRVDWGRDLRGDPDRSEAHSLVDPLEQLLSESSLVSVDLFDTLLLRPALDPDRIHDLLAIQFDASTDDASGTGRRLIDLRVASERAARLAIPSPGDVRLDEIYELATTTSPDDGQRLARLQELEIQIEHRLAIGRTWLIELLREHRAATATRMILMTDTTLPRASIDALLHDIGATDLFDAVYVSAECGARKDSGTMWDLARGSEHCDGAWLHIGDNAFSDVQQAADRGLRWFHVPAPSSLVERARIPAGKVDVSQRSGSLGAELVAGLGLASLAARQRPGQATGVEAFGHSVLGPITYTFVDWLLRSAAERGVDRLLFTARDGALAQRMLHQVAAMRPDIAPHDDYFHISRRLTLGLLQHGGPRLNEVFAAGEFSGTVGDLLAARLGFELPGPLGAELAAEHVELPADAERLHAALVPFEPLIRVQGTAELTGFRRAVADLGIGPDEHLGLVDLGYGGTAQAALTQVMDQQITGFYYVTSPAAAALGDAAVSCFGRDVTFGGGNLIYENNLVFEALCSAGHPQVACNRLDGSVEFAPGTEIDPARMAEILAAQDAAIGFATNLAERFGPVLFGLPVDPILVHEALAAAAGPLFDQPRQAFQHLVSDDLFCGRDQAVLASFVPSPWPAPSAEHRIAHL